MTFIINTLKKINRGLYYLYLIVNVYSIFYLIRSFFSLLDLFFSYLIMFFVNFYRYFRDLFYFICFRTVGAYFQLIIIILAFLSHDLRFLGGHVYYLLVTSDVYDVKLKWRRFASTWLILIFLVIIRLYLYGYLLISRCFLFPIIFYLSNLCLELCLDLYNVLFNLSIAIYRLHKSFITYTVHFLCSLFNVISFFISELYLDYYQINNSVNKRNLSIFFKKFTNIVRLDTKAVLFTDSPFFFPRFFYFKLHSPRVLPISFYLSYLFKDKVQILFFLLNILLIYPVLFLSRSCSYVIVITVYKLSKLLSLAMFYIYFFISFLFFTLSGIIIYICLCFCNFVCRKSEPVKTAFSTKVDCLLSSLFFKSMLRKNTTKLDYLSSYWLSSYIFLLTSNKHIRLQSKLGELLPLVSLPPLNKKKKPNYFVYKHYFLNSIKASNKMYKIPLIDLLQSSIDSISSSSSPESHKLYFLFKYINTILNASIPTDRKFNIQWLVLKHILSRHFFKRYHLITHTLKDQLKLVFQLYKGIHRAYPIYMSMFPIKRFLPKDVWPIRYYKYLKWYLVCWLYTIFLLLVFSIVFFPILLFYPFILASYCVYLLVVSPVLARMVFTSTLYKLVDYIETVIIVFISSIINLINRMIKGIKYFITNPNKMIPNINRDNTNAILSIALVLSLLILGIILFGLVIKYLIPLIILLIRLIIEEINTIITVSISSFPYMIYNIPKMYPTLSMAYYCLLNVYKELMSNITLYNYYYYKNYLDILLYTNDFHIIQNFFTVPSPINRDYLPLNKLHNTFPHNKYNLYRHSMKNWKVQYNLGDFIPTNIYTTYYFLKYQIYYNYILFYTSYDSWTKGLSKPLYEWYYTIHRKVLRTTTSRYGDRNVDLGLMIYMTGLLALYCQKSYKYYLEAIYDYSPTEELEILAEDRIDYDLEFVDSEEHESIDVLEDQTGDLYYKAAIEWLPEFKMDYDIYLDITEQFDLDYINTESEFDAKFNQYLCEENQYDLYIALQNNRDS